MPFSFLNGALMWGSGLVSVPIIIHLLNRQRYRVIDWAAMEWLLLAIKQNRRRMTIEQLILLALRCLIIFLTVLAVSKIFFSGTSRMIGQLAGNRTDWVVVLDDSFTAGQSTSTGACFDQAKKEVIALLRNVLGAGDKDSFNVIFPHKEGVKLPPGPQADWDLEDRLSRKLKNANPSGLTHSSAQLIECGLAALEGSQTANKALVIVSDCRQSSWNPKDAGLLEQIDKAKAAKVKTYLIDVGPPETDDPANVAVVKLGVTTKIIEKGADAEIEAIVKNFGKDTVTDVPVTFTITSPDQKESVLPTKTVEEITPGKTARKAQFFRVDQSGTYAVRVEIGKDSLPADNTRHFALDVRRGVEALLVDGEPGGKRSERETYALEIALKPGRKSKFGIHPTVIQADQLAPGRINAADVILLANVKRVSGDNLQALRRFVRRGGGLAIFLGDQVDPQTFNERFWEAPKSAEGSAGENGGENGSDAAGPLSPCKLKKAVGDVRAKGLTGGDFLRLDTDKLAHPMMSVFQDTVSVILSGVRFYRRFEVESPDTSGDSDVAVVAWYAGSNESSPAIIERKFGKGRVVLITSTADREWNTWPSHMTYPVVMNRLAEHLFTPPTSQRNLVCGREYVRVVDVSQHELQVRISAPGQGGEKRSTAETRKTSKEPLLTHGGTATPGIYTLKLKRHSPVEASPGAEEESGAPQGIFDIEYFAANVDTGKSDLKRPDPSAFRSTLGDAKVGYGRNAEDIWKLTRESHVNLWQVVLLALACCMALESFLAWKFGHHTKQ